MADQEEEGVPIRDAHVCLKYSIGPHFFHEHATFATVDEAAEMAMSLIARMNNALNAIEDGTMLDAATIKEIEAIGTFPEDTDCG